ncbi:MAG: MBL fold metallo-hydrolase [Chlamydiia bacterium]|nr:MBL fold metallo-hydrolase [Chlamydiia bacterium]
MEISLKELNEEFGQKKRPLILDVRNQEAVKKSNLTDYFDLPFKNIPFMTMLSENDSDDTDAVLKEYVQKHLKKTLSSQEPVVVVCAKGRSSKMVTDALIQSGVKAKSLEGGMKAWGKFYESKVVSDQKNLKIIQVIRPARGCLGYLLSSEKEAVIIDPAHHLEVYRKLLSDNNLKLKCVLDTHAHADHISGGKALADEYKALYFLHPYDGIHPMDMLPAVFDYEFMKGEKTLKFGNAEIRAIHVPGHTLGNMAYLVNEEFLFTGDSIFISSIARPDLGGKGDTWAPLHYRSLKKLLELKDSTKILPAHFSGIQEADEKGVFVGTLRAIKSSNGDLKETEKSEEAFVDFILASLPDFPKEYIEIKRVNLGLSKPDEEKAEELEQGKNLCALVK